MFAQALYERFFLHIFSHTFFFTLFCCVNILIENTRKGESERARTRERQRQRDRETETEIETVFSSDKVEHAKIKQLNIHTYIDIYKG